MPSTIYVDLDGVVFNTIETIVKMYNNDFRNYRKYTPVDWTNVNTWDFKECACMSKRDMNNYFKSARFFDELELMPFAIDTLDKLSEDYHIKFVSLGSRPNLRGKDQFIKQTGSQFSSILLNEKIYHDKSTVNMSNGIMIDDRADNLFTSNAIVKICFGETYPWNEDWEGLRARNWYDVEYMIRKMEKRGLDKEIECCNNKQPLTCKRVTEQT